MQVHPLRFEPIFKRRMWGGQVLGHMFDKRLPADQLVGESWELVDLPSDRSVVAEGPMKGKRIDELVREWGRALLGRAALIDGSFPLLIKFLDAAQDLSVQGHPDEAMVSRQAGSGDQPHPGLDCTPPPSWFKTPDRMITAAFIGPTQSDSSRRSER